MVEILINITNLPESQDQEWIDLWKFLKVQLSLKKHCKNFKNGLNTRSNQLCCLNNAGHTVLHQESILFSAMRTSLLIQEDITKVLKLVETIKVS